MRLYGFQEKLQWTPCCVQSTTCVWFQIQQSLAEGALHLWVISPGKSITNARTEQWQNITNASPPCWARLVWWVLLYEAEHHLQGERSCILLGMGAPASKCKVWMCLWKSSEFKVTWDALLKTWPGRERKGTAGCRYSLHFWRTAPMETEAS